LVSAETIGAMAARMRARIRMGLAYSTPQHWQGSLAKQRRSPLPGLD